MSARRAVTAASAVTVGVTTGVLFSFAVGVMPGLHDLPDDEFITAFQHIDDAITNPLFTVVAFTGGAVALVAATVMERRDMRSPRFVLNAAASLLYIAGVVVVTMAGNVPKNDRLGKIDVATSTLAQLAAARSAFEGSWNTLNVVRTVAGVAALALVAVAATIRPRLKENTS